MLPEPIKFFEARVALITEWNKKDAIALLLPKEIKDGFFLDFKGNVISNAPKGSEDTVFHDDDFLDSQKSVTAAFVKRAYAPVEKFLKAGPTEDECDADNGSEDEDDAPVELSLLEEVAELIKNDKVKKAKKLVKASKEHADYKAAKKLVKGAE